MDDHRNHFTLGYHPSMIANSNIATIKSHPTKKKQILENLIKTNTGHSHIFIKNKKASND